MLSDAVWLMYALGIGILLGVGLLGFFFSCSFSVCGGISKETALIISILIIITGIYFLYQWNAQKAEVRQLGQQVESALGKYFMPSQKENLISKATSETGRR